MSCPISRNPPDGTPGVAHLPMIPRRRCFLHAGLPAGGVARTGLAARRLRRAIQAHRCAPAIFATRAFFERKTA
jgi:hypothetical protein